MNRKAFTLIEMIVVIVLIGIVLVIAIPNVINLSQKQKEDKFNAQFKLFGEAINLYTIRHKGELYDRTISGSTSVTYDEMIQENLLKNCEECTCTGQVEIYRKLDNTYKFNYSLSCDIGKDNTKHFERAYRGVKVSS